MRLSMRLATVKSYYTSRRQVSAGTQSATIDSLLATDINRSDIHFWRTGRIGSLVVEGDCILGHEASGIVLQCGEGVKNLRPGRSARPELSRII